MAPASAPPMQDSLSWAHDNGVMQALPDGSFAPDAPVSRGDLALALHRFAGAPTPDLHDVPVLLADVPEDPDQAAAVLWLHGRGALWGDAELRVHPGEPTTREASRGILTALLGPALTSAGIDATAALEAALAAAHISDGRAGSGSSAGDGGDAGNGGDGDTSNTDNDSADGAAPLTRAALATTLHSVDQALTS